MFFLFIITIFGISFIPPSFSHLEHLPHNNGGGEALNKYYVNQALEPDFAKPGEPTEILFSIQDWDGNDVYDIKTMTEIYKPNGERIRIIPWSNQIIGDLEIPYTFVERGNYQIVISVAEGDSKNQGNSPPRNILLSTFDCECERAVFNISITEELGDIWSGAMISVILFPMSIFGFALAANYLRLKNKGLQPARDEMIKYIIMLLALAGGMVHLGVYAEHAGLRLEYSIFLLIAAIMQIIFGVMYVSLTIFGSPKKQTIKSAKSYYRNTKKINIFGLIGTAILVGLYIYTIIYPPPLAPNDEPEEIDFSGVLAKSVEISLIVGIVYLMKYEKKKFKMMLIKDVSGSK